MALQWENAGPAYYISAIALLSVLFIVSGIFFMRSQLPKRRTLEWISFVDKPKAFRGCRDASLSVDDVLLIALLAVIAVGLQSCLFFCSARGFSLKSLDFLTACNFFLLIFVAPCVCCGCAFIMCKRVTKNSTFAFLTGCLVALDMSYRPQSAAFVMLSMAFLLRWWGEQSEKNRALALALCAVFAAVGAYVSPQLWLLLLPITLFLLLGSILQKRFGFLRFFKSLGIFTGCYILILIAVNIPGVMYQTGLAFPQMLFSGTFWRFLFLRIFQQVLFSPAFILPSIDIMSPVLLLYGLFAAVFSVIAGLPRQDLRCVVVTLLFVCIAFLWLFGLVSGSLAAFLPIAYYWFLWNKRGGKWIIRVSAALLLASALALDVILFFML